MSSRMYTPLHSSHIKKHVFTHNGASFDSRELSFQLIALYFRGLRYVNLLIGFFCIYFDRAPSLCGHNPGRAVFRRVQDAGRSEDSLVSGFAPLTVSRIATIELSCTPLIN